MLGFAGEVEKMKRLWTLRIMAAQRHGRSSYLHRRAVEAYDRQAEFVAGLKRAQAASDVGSR